MEIILENGHVTTVTEKEKDINLKYINVAYVEVMKLDSQMVSLYG